MTMLSQLIEKAKKSGSLVDFQCIADILIETEISDEFELYDALRVLLNDAQGKGYGTQFATICEPYLYREDMPFVSSRVLTMLCCYVYPVTRYTDFIKRALRGFSWDTERDLQSSASVLADNLFASTHDSEIICIMIDTLNSGEEKRYAYTYGSLLRIVGVKHGIPWRDWITKPPKSLVDWNLIQRLSQEHGCR